MRRPWRVTLGRPAIDPARLMAWAILAGRKNPDPPPAPLRDDTFAVYQCQRCGVMWVAADVKDHLRPRDGYSCDSRVGGCGRIGPLLCLPESKVRESLALIERYRAFSGRNDV